MAWIQMPDLPGYLYNKKTLEEIGGLIGKVTKLNFNTDNGLRGWFARMAIFVNLDKLLISKILIKGNLQRIDYEILQSICFSCGRYGHVKELCPILVGDKDLTGEKRRRKRRNPQLELRWKTRLSLVLGWSSKGVLARVRRNFAK
ncbi:hypothetical protein Golob_003675 [Gossypium lobatum]|uniref:CCHC-type domain-containing protein n=1 Tax=Gossypium lobatum TaxID=34289 RepID=A0A7J8MZA6_9ROSI|nr:hypothetical protein [Gossypium lobatum]